MKSSPGWSGDRAATPQTFFLVISAVLLVFAAVSATVWLVSIDRGKRAVEQRQEELRKAGYRLTLFEIDQLYHDPSLDPAENAEPHYREAFSFLSSGSELAEAYLRIREAFLELQPGEELSDEIARELVEVMEQTGPAREALKAAAGRPYVRFNLNFPDGHALLIPHVGRMREAGRLLSLQAIQHHTEGRPDAAIEALETALAIAAHLGDEPTLISQLTRIAIAGIVLEAMEWFFHRETASAVALKEFDAVLGRLENVPGMALALEGELAFGNDLFAGPLADVLEINELDGEFPLILHVLSGRVHRDHLFYLEAMESGMNTVRGPLEHWLAFDEHLWAREAKEKRFLFSAMIMPTIARVLQSEVILATRLRIGRILIALERHRIEEGHLPENLELLAPRFLAGLPVDPYSGESFQMKREGEWLVIESAGEAEYRPDRKMRPIRGRVPAER